MSSGVLRHVTVANHARAHEQHVSVSPWLAQREEQSVCALPYPALACTGYAQKLINPNGNYVCFPNVFQSPIKSS